MFKKNYFALVSLLFVISLLCLSPVSVSAGTITGPIQLASSGKGFPNGTLTFTLTQAAVVSGTATIVTSPVNCYTDGLGNVVGLPNPLVLPVLSSVNSGGTLPPGNYFVRTTWANSSGETVPGPERSINTTQTGQLVVQVPANPPANATQWKIYIGATSGAEMLQATQTAPFISNYSQTTPLSAGAAMPGSNTTTCSLRFNDELQPSYTGYNVTFNTATGATVPGFPQKWYLSGGSSGTINVGSGLPLYNGTVVYPQPIIANPAQSATQSINGPLNMNGFKLTDSNINGFFYVDGTTFTTIQQAITAACAVGGGTVFIPSGTYPQNSPFTLCSNLNLIGAGRCQADANSSCPTLITTTMTSGDLFPITNMTDIHLSDFGVRSGPTGGANAFIRLNYGQRVVVERLYLYGGAGPSSAGSFNVGIELDSFSTSGGSTIWNQFRDIHITGLSAGGIGCLLDSHDATNKVINNNYFFNVSCQGGSTGSSAAGVVLRNTNNQQSINENVFFSGEIATTSAVGGGTGILIGSTATRGITFVECNIENNVTGFNKAVNNTAIFIAGNISANTTNIVDAQPSFTSFLNTFVGGVQQTFAVTPAGGIQADGIGLAGGAPFTNGINMAPGGCLATSGTCRLTVATADPKVTAASFSVNGGPILTGETGSGSNLVTSIAPTIASPQFNSGITSSGTGLKHGRVTTGAIGATTRADVTLSWAGTAFADTNYTPTCSVIETGVATGSQSLVIERIHNINTGSIVASVFNGSGGTLTGTLTCSAFHD